MDFMVIALSEAEKALREGEVPIGCVITKEGKIISKSHNIRERKKNAILHAEIVAIDKACKKLKSWRLDDCEMYVTLEPCKMCIGAAINARIKKIYIGAKSTTDLNWKTETVFCENEKCKNILVDFFKKRR